MAKRVAGKTIFRCRKCDTLTLDPIDHVLETHPTLPSTMAQVWEGFALVGIAGAAPTQMPGQEPLDY